MTDTKLDTLPDPKTSTTGSNASFTEKAKEAAHDVGVKASSAAATAKEKASSAASTAREKATDAGSRAVEAAKEHPYAAAGIAAGVAAAVAGGVYAATKLGSSSDTKPKTTRGKK